MNKEIILGGKRIAADSPTFIVAEMSANHLQDYHRALEILRAGKGGAGADAIKLQNLHRSHHDRGQRRGLFCE